MTGTTTVENADPQSIFWQKSDKPVPPEFEKRLTDLFGRDDMGDARIRVRYDAERFKEGVWIVEEKWEPHAFGDPDEWRRTQKVQDEYGVVDFGEFPRRGLYMSIMVWTDHEGRPMGLGDQLIERLQFQRQMREQKNISPAQVAANTEMRLQQTEKIQKERWEAAQRDIAEDLKTNLDKYIAEGSRIVSIPSSVKSANIAQ